MVIECLKEIIDWDSPNLFRYVGESEYKFIMEKGYVKSINPKGTYWTTLLTEDPQCAKQLLKLPREVRYRVAGPVFSDTLKCILFKPLDYEEEPIPHRESGVGITVTAVIIRKPLPPASIFDMVNKSLIA